MAIKDNLNYKVVSSGITWDEQGIAEATLIAHIGSGQAVAKALTIYNHPDYPWMLRSGGRVTAKEAGVAEINLQFRGIDPDLDGQVTSTIRAATSTEPIDTHPNFGNMVDKGWAKDFAPKKDDAGVFAGFPPKMPEKFIDENGIEQQRMVDNPKAGIESYLEPAVTFEQSKIFAEAGKRELQSHCQRIGRIDSSFFRGQGIPEPPTPEGDNGKPRNWLLISAGYEDIGKGGKVTKVWRLSGRRGWDAVLYS